LGDAMIDPGRLRPTDAIGFIEHVLTGLRDKTAVTHVRIFPDPADRLIGHPAKPLFVTDKVARLTDCAARHSFARACQKIGLRTHQPYCKHGRGPRIHDLRHSFAVKTMIGWYRTGKEPAREMIRLTSNLDNTKPSNTYWFWKRSRSCSIWHVASDRQWPGGRPVSAALPALIQRFFTDRLCGQMEASRHTIAGYRDTFRLLLRYASARHGKPPVKLTMEDVDPDLVADFLVHSESRRPGNQPQQRPRGIIRITAL